MKHTEHQHDDYKPHLDPEQPALFEIEAPEKQFEYQILNDPELRYKYVRLTEGLIARSLANDIDSMVFLDKSARPVAWLMRALWPTLGFKEFDASGKPIIAPMPEAKFANIDREQWAHVMGRSEVREGQGLTLENVHPDTIDSLTGLFAQKNMDADDYIAKDEATLFDDKNVLIVDEVSASGDTLRMAAALFGRAFQNANSIEEAHWMTPEKKYDKRSGGTRNAELPVWYKRDDPYGRLVGDRDDLHSSHSPSMRQRRGAMFLSGRLPQEDAKGKQLREEMYQLGRDVASGEMPVKFNTRYRPDDDEFMDNFMLQVNGVTRREYATLQEQAEVEGIPFVELFNQYKHDKK